MAKSGRGGKRSFGNSLRQLGFSPNEVQAITKLNGSNSNKWTIQDVQNALQQGYSQKQIGQAIFINVPYSQMQQVLNPSQQPAQPAQAQQPQQAQQQTQQPAILQATSAPAPANLQSVLNQSSQTLTDTEAQQIRNFFDAQYKGSPLDAIKQYIRKDGNYTNDGLSISQDMNRSLATGKPLDVTQKFVDKYIQKAMHSLGKDVTLFRGAHLDDVAPIAGVKNFNNMTPAQLKASLVGGSWTSSAYTSTSYDYNKSPFLSGGLAGGREVIMEIRAKNGTPVVFGAKDQTEVIMNKGLNFKIVDAQFTGNIASPKNGQSSKQIKIVVEVG